MGYRPSPPSDKKHVVYVYGTLRPGSSPTVDIPGIMYDLGSYPGVCLKSPTIGKFFKAERIEVDDKGLRELDQYEGYRPDNKRNSLYLRVPYMDGEIYVYNFDFDGRPEVECGDWLKYTGQTFGRASETFDIVAAPGHFPVEHNQTSVDDIQEEGRA